MTINMAGTWRDTYTKEDGYYCRVNADGSQTGRMRGGVLLKHLCFNSPAVDNIIVPAYRDAAAKYHPSQIWIDEGIVTVNYCWCENCVRLFRQEYGFEPPVSASDPHWEEWAKFHRDTFVRWMKKIVDAVHSVDPNTIVTFNNGYFVCQPEPVPDFITNLSGDILDLPLRLGVYARYGAAAGVPFDLMPGLSVDAWAGVKPKTTDEILRDTAVITANGGRLNIGEFPTAGTRPVDEYVKLALAATEFARERQPWVHQTSSMAYAAILHSASTHYAKVLPEYAEENQLRDGTFVSQAGTVEFISSDMNPGKSRLFWVHNYPTGNDILGAYEAMLENHVHFDIIHEGTLTERLSEYKLLVLTEQFRLTDETVEKIRQFVRDGGSVIATGRTARERLGDVLGVELVREIGDSSITLDVFDQLVTVESYVQVKPTTAEVLYYLDEREGTPLVTLNRYGEGLAVYVSTDLFSFYHDYSPYNDRANRSFLVRGRADALRQFVDELLRTSLPDAPCSIDAPPWIEVALRSKDGATLVQLINRSIEWGQKRSDGEITISLELTEKPGAVTLQPSGTSLDWTWRDSRLEVTLSVSQVGIHSILEVR